MRLALSLAAVLLGAAKWQQHRDAAFLRRLAAAGPRARRRRAMRGWRLLALAACYGPAGRSLRSSRRTLRSATSV